MSCPAGRSNPSAARCAAALLIIFSLWTCAIAQDTGEGSPQPDGPWIESFFIYLAPTMARLHGDGYQPGVTLWLDVTAPPGTVYTTQVVADEEGRIVADVAVDEAGTHQTQVRDGAGQVLSEGELLVGLQ